MNTTQKVYAQTLLKLKVLESSGSAFQDLFEKVMKKAEPEFHKVKPHGKEGDHKNDGFVPSKGIYYQVYSPERPEKSEAKAIKKLHIDFDGLVSYWDGKFKVKEFYFVFNDHYKGKSPLLHSAISEIDGKHTDIKVGIFCCDDLQRLFLALSDLDLQEIIGLIPKDDSEVVDLGVLSEVVGFLLENEQRVDYSTSLSVPDFNEKIRFNDLSDAVSSLLVSGSFQAFVLDQFFEQNPASKDLLQKVFTKFYREGVESIEADIQDKSDLVFFKILERANGKASARIQTAVLALMACFFETCDIFEEPR